MLSRNCGSLDSLRSLGMTVALPRSVVAAAVTAALALALAGTAAAQGAPPPLTPEQTRAANSAMERLKSPVTPAHTVDMCPSVPALRDSIRVAAAAGMSADQIVDDVVARHGERIRVLPKRSGAGLLAWLATPLVVLIGGGLIFSRLRRDGAAAAREPEPTSTLSADEQARLAAALRGFDEAEEPEV